MARVYVSSTLLDMEPEREAVLEWLQARGHLAVTSYTPAGDTVRESCLEDVGGCDLYVLMAGHRYGFVPAEDNPEGLSITQLEFRRAEHVPRIALLRTAIDEKTSDIYDPGLFAKVRAFRAEVADTVRAAEFADLPSLLLALSAGVEKALERGPGAEPAWRRENLRQLRDRFAERFRATALGEDADPARFFLRLLVSERVERRDGGTSGAPAVPLDEVHEAERAPAVLVGEGGAGKTVSLLDLAVRAAERSVDDPGAPVPVYVNLARLTKLDDVADLLQLVADSVPGGGGWTQVSELEAFRRGRILFLLDSFNEMPDRTQRTAVSVLQRLAAMRSERDTVLVAGRAGGPVLDLASGSPRFRIVEILRLGPGEVRGFLERSGIATLYDRLPSELRELAGNPFMLWAIARALAGTRDEDLPRNVGALYERFVGAWMAKEDRQGEGAYSFSRVKQPLLARLALRMTAGGVTAMPVDEPLEQLVEDRLTAMYERLRRRGGMPEDWQVDDCLRELLDDGLLRGVDDRLQFIHQSVQEHFVARHWQLTDADPADLARLVPRLDADQVATFWLTDPPAHRLVPALLNLAGLLPDASALVRALADRDPVLAGAAMASAAHVDAVTAQSLVAAWTARLAGGDARELAVGLSALAAYGRRDPALVGRLVDLAINRDRDTYHLAHRIMARPEWSHAMLADLLDRVVLLSDEEFAERSFRLGAAVREVPPEIRVPAAVARWRTAPEDVRGRLLGLVGEVTADQARTLLGDRWDSALEAALEDGRRAAPVLTLGDGLLRRLDAARQQQEALVEQESARMREADPAAIAEYLRSDDANVRTAAARAAAVRRLPLGDQILDLIVRGAEGHYALVAALAELEGEPAAARRIAAGLGVAERLAGRLPDGADELVRELSEGAVLPPALCEALAAAGVRETSGLRVEGGRAGEGARTWRLAPDAWTGARALLELRRAADGGLDVYDLGVAARAAASLVHLPGAESTRHLHEAAFGPAGPGAGEIALREIARRRAPGVGAEVLAALREPGEKDVAMLLEVLGDLGGGAVAGLVEELTLLDGDGGHPLWEAPDDPGGWAEQIHAALRRADAETEVSRALRQALGSSDPVVRAGVLAEYGRWIEGFRDGPATPWTDGDLGAELLRLALHDEAPEVRRAASAAAGGYDRDAASAAFLRAARAPDLAAALAGAEALAQADPEGGAAEIAAVAERCIAEGDPGQRRRGYRLLGETPGGDERLHGPVASALGEGRFDEALRGADDLLRHLPGDVDLHWWRAHALWRLGRPAEAVEAFRRAEELADGTSLVPSALAGLLIELGDPAGALEAARRAVEQGPEDIDARTVLARALYAAGDHAEAAAAARAALDIDPTHEPALHIALLAALRAGHAGAAATALDDLRRVVTLLFPGEPLAVLGAVVTELGERPVEEPATGELARDVLEYAGSGEGTGRGL